MTIKFYWVVALLCVGLCSGVNSVASATSGATETRFAKWFGEHMVLQRDEPIVIWGEGLPGEKLTVHLGGQTRKAKVSKLGRWQVKFRPLPVGGPYTLEMETSEAAVALNNVMIGDVWLCSGQSNMAWQVKQSSGTRPWSGKPPKNIRLVTVPRDQTVTPQVEFNNPIQWQVATEESLESFSSVCAYFAQNLSAQSNIPLGLVNNSWGGSVAEAWVSQSGLKALRFVADDLALLNAYIESPVVAGKQYEEQWTAWWQAQNQPWQYDEVFHWKVVPQLGDWNDFGDPALEGHDGLVWYAKTFELTPSQAAQGATLKLGGIDEVDMTWMNGHFVGSQFGWGTPRVYELSKGILQPGRNRLVTNVLSTWGQAGLIGPPGALQLVLENGDSIALGDDWRYSKVPSRYGYPRSAPWHSINGMSTLYNAMVAPMANANIAGVLWYQGESNTGRASEYEALLSALMDDWRETFGNTTPFVVVQLPNFGADAPQPVNAGWASLRHAQSQAVRQNPRNGLVVTIDLGDDKDIHPKDKTKVGKRAADVVLAMRDQAKGPIQGIIPKSAKREGSVVRVSFEPASEALTVQHGPSPTMFELCDEQCHRVTARVEGNTVVLEAASVTDAKTVRYCWADAPKCKLYGQSGLPVSSFEVTIQ